MKLRVLIADDEPLARKRLRQFLQAESGFEIVGECATGTETVQAILAESPDLVLLDVQMPGMDGFQVLQSLDGAQIPAIIFVTAHDQFAVRAFEEHAADYLLKPFDGERFQKALGRAREMAMSRLGQVEVPVKVQDRFAIRSHGRIVFVKTQEIKWIQSADNYSELHAGSAVHLLRQTLATLSGQLHPAKFMRISRSHIVNVDFIKELQPKSHGDCLVVLQDGTKLPASRNYRKELLRMMGCL